MHASDVWMIFITLALVMYVVLDGYDLGIGVFTLVERDEWSRQEMHALVGRAWDGNESWIVLLAVAAFGGLPLAFGLASPAVYIPLILMLFALIWRGISIEILDQYPTWQRGWGAAFGLGSLVAALSRGRPLVASWRGARRTERPSPAGRPPSLQAGDARASPARSPSTPAACCCSSVCCTRTWCRRASRCTRRRPRQAR